MATWLAPACLFGLFWFAMTAMPLLTLWSVPVSPYGSAFILLCCLIVSAAGLFVPRPRRPAAASQPLSNTKFLRRCFYLASVAAFSCAVLNSLAQGISWHDLVFNMIVSAASYRDLAESGEINMSTYARVSEILAYVAVALGGLLFPLVKSRRSRFAILALAFLPAVFIALAQSTKWALFSGLAFFYGGSVVTRASRGDFRLLGNLRLKKLLVVCMLLLAVSVGSFMSRGVDATDLGGLASQLKYYFASYSSGHLYAFSDWCSFRMGTRSELWYERQGATTYGFHTFAPLFGALGSRRAQQVDDYYVYGSDIRSNIYTIFRGLVQDFGFFGSLLFMFAVGIVMHLAFWRSVHNPGRGLSVSVCIFAVGFIYYSFGRSIFTWSGLYFSFALVWLILVANRYPEWKRALRAKAPSHPANQQIIAG